MKGRKEGKNWHVHSGIPLTQETLDQLVSRLEARLKAINPNLKLNAISRIQTLI